VLSHLAVLCRPAIFFALGSGLGLGLGGLCLLFIAGQVLLLLQIIPSGLGTMDGGIIGIFTLLGLPAPSRGVPDLHPPLRRVHGRRRGLARSPVGAGMLAKTPRPCRRSPGDCPATARPIPLLPGRARARTRPRGVRTADPGSPPTTVLPARSTIWFADRLGNPPLTAVGQRLHLGCNLKERAHGAVNLKEARKRLSDLVRAAEYGETTVITRRGKRVACIVPVKKSRRRGLPDLTEFRNSIKLRASR